MSDFEKENNFNETKIDHTFKKEGRISSLRSECSEDFILPDYMGDIKKVLSSSATVTPCNKYVSENEISLLNLVTFRVLYLDSEDVLTEASFTKDFEINEKISQGLLDFDAVSNVHNVTVRLGGPRKISAKASIVSDISYVAEEEFPTENNFKNAECKYKKIKIHATDYKSSGEREYAEEIGVIDEVTSDEIEVVKYDAEAFIDSVYKTDSGFNVSGSLNARCVLRVGDDIMRLEKSIPIEEGIEMDNSDIGVCYPRAYVSGAHININNSTDDKNTGECYASVVMNMTVECAYVNHYNSEYTVVSDAFYENSLNEHTYAGYGFNELIGGIFEKRKISFTYKRAENLMHDVVDKDFCVRNVKCSLAEDELTVSADLDFCIVSSDAKDTSCYSEKFTETINEKIKMNGVSESSIVRAHVTPCEFSPSFDNDKIYIEAYVSMFLVCESSKSETLLASLSSKESAEGGQRTVLVYYPEKNDTLWQVAKKYSVPERKILRYNPTISGIDGDEVNLSGVEKIIIVN